MSPRVCKGPPLPFRKPWDTFDFAFPPSIDERPIREWATWHGIDAAANLLFLGPPGVGQSPLTVSLALQAIQARQSVYVVTIQDMIADRRRAGEDHRFTTRLAVYTRPTWLCVDEGGDLPLERLDAPLFFRGVSARYARGSMILTSHKSFSEWGEVFGDAVLAPAILDRWLHHSTVVHRRGESYRLREKKRSPGRDGALGPPPSGAVHPSWRGGDGAGRAPHSWPRSGKTAGVANGCWPTSMAPIRSRGASAQPSNGISPTSRLMGRR